MSGIGWARRAAAASLLLALAAAGCGYALVGRGSFLPPDIQTIYFPTFQNLTTRIGVEQRLTRAVAEELASRGRFQVTADSSKGEAELSGAIVAFSLTPVTFDSQGRATQYQVQIVARVALTRRPEGKVLWKNDSYVFTGNYQFTSSPAAYVDRENEAIDGVADQFAQSLVTNLLEGF
jgi:outer membrane lipopolysaccharide assembly protein LptE/RlpB